MSSTSSDKYIKRDLNLDIGFERFEEDFHADLNTMYIKPNQNNEDLERYTQITTKTSREQKERFLKEKRPLVMASWERYIERLSESDT